MSERRTTVAEHDPALVLAYLRCADQHPERHDQGGVGTCAACTSWGEHAAATVAPAIREAALLKAARHFEYEMAPAWGGDSTWISTGSHVADLVGSTLRDMAAQQREEQG